MEWGGEDRGGGARKKVRGGQGEKECRGRERTSACVRAKEIGSEREGQGHVLGARWERRERERREERDECEGEDEGVEEVRNGRMDSGRGLR